MRFRKSPDSFQYAAASKLIRLGLRALSQRNPGSSDLFDSFAGIADAVSPRSLNGCDRLLEPRILLDFPDFDFTLAKTYVREALTERYGANDRFVIHNVVIAKYLPSAVQKTVVYQAGAAWYEGGVLLQKRFDLHYTYLLSADSQTVAANCPNCGGALGYGETVCSFCDSRIVNPLGNAWQFTQISES